MPMPVLADSCDNGPCPTFYQAQGGVVVQAQKTNDPEHIPPDMPEHEGVLFIPQEAWDKLISNLPSQP